MKDSQKTIQVEADQAGARLDQFLAAVGAGLTRSQAQKLIKQGCVLIDGEAAKASATVFEGDEIEISIPEKSGGGEGPAAVEMPLDILFEDEHLLIVNKPAGLVVHEAAGHQGDTLLNGLLHHLGEAQRQVKGGDRPGIVHRLDKDTSGCLAVAKSDQAYDGLVAQLADHSAGRVYQAWVWGGFEEDEGSIDAPIGRHPGDRQKMAVVKNGGKPAVTHFKVLQRAPNATLLELRLETGRTHQIRVHLSEIGHAVVGDPDYGGLKGPKGWAAPLERQALHAQTLNLTHPVHGEALSVSAPLPEDFVKAGINLLDVN